MNQIPHEVSEMVHRTAREIVIPSFSVDEVKARGVRLRRRRRVVFSATAAALVVATAVAMPPLVRHLGPSPRTPAAATPSRTATISHAVWRTAAQRLVLDQGAASVGTDTGSAEIDAPAGFVELLPDGRLRTLSTPHFNAGILDLIALSGGGQVLLGIVDLMPGVARGDGDNVAGVEDRLVARRPDGSVITDRNVRIQGEALRLVDADDTSAFLWRTTGMYQRDLVSGRETRLAGPSAVFTTGTSPGDGTVDLHARPVTVAPGAQLVAGLTSRMPGHCLASNVQGAREAIVVVGFDGNPLTLSLPQAQVGCSVLGMRFSPAGDALAVVYAVVNGDGADATPIQARLAIFDSHTGAVMTDTPLFSAAMPAQLFIGGSDLRGLAWLDERTVRAAIDTLPDNASGHYHYQDLLRTVDLTVR
jgi:hypothetical protein